MSAARIVTLICDGCGLNLDSKRHTVNGARGDAERKGWRVQYLAGGMHPTKISADPQAADLCPSCRPDKPRADVGLFADGGVR